MTKEERKEYDKRRYESNKEKFFVQRTEYQKANKAQRCRICIYKNGEFETEKPTPVEAAQYAKVSPMVVRNVLTTNQKITRNGWTFSQSPLSLQELEKIKEICDKREQQFEERLEKKRSKEAEKEAADNNEFYFSRSRTKAKEEFKQFLFTKLRERWMSVPKQVALLEKQYINKFLEII